MDRNVTAIYRSHTAADQVRRALMEFGISPGYIHVIPDEFVPAGAGGTDPAYIAELHDLHLPDDDLHTYQGSVRRGDYVVSVEVGHDEVPRVIDIMRRPEAEAQDIDRRSAEVGDEELIARREEGITDPGRRGVRDAEYVDPYTRADRREWRLNERR